MVQVTRGQSQLSGWGHYAEPTALFINKVPDPFMVGDTIDISAVTEPGGTELHFSDGTVLSYRQSSNLLPALNNVTVWSLPEAGTVVPNNLDYVTIYASYTTKHGKTLNAVPVKVPVVVPLGIQVVTDENYKAYENRYEMTPGLYDPEKMPLDKSKYSTWCLYGQGSDPTPVYFKQIDNPSYKYEGIIYEMGGGYNNLYYVTAYDNPKQDITVYHTVNEPSVESFTNAIGIKATATIGGRTFESNQAYIEGIPAVYFSLANFPTTTGQHTFTSEGFIFHFKDGTSEAAIADLTDAWICFSTAAPTWNNVRQTLTMNFTEGSTGSIWLVRRKTPITQFESTKYNYSVTDGVISWTREDE